MTKGWIFCIPRYCRGEHISNPHIMHEEAYMKWNVYIDLHTKKKNRYPEKQRYSLTEAVRMKAEQAFKRASGRVFRSVTRATDHGNNRTSLTCIKTTAPGRWNSRSWLLLKWNGEHGSSRTRCVTKQTAFRVRQLVSLGQLSPGIHLDEFPALSLP